MKMWKTERKNEIFRVLKGRNNCYLIPSGYGHVLVDTGVKSAYSSIKKNIETLHLVPGNIDYLILTHTHFDHCQNAAALQKEYGCKIVVGDQEADFTDQGFTPLPRGTYAFTRFLVGVGNTMKKRFEYLPFHADIRIGESHTLIDGDIKIELISTPGHSAGSISILVDDEIAIVGDVMIHTFGDSIFPPFADQVPETIRSWQKLLSTDCRIFLPGHRPAVSREMLERQFRKYESATR